MLLMVPLAGCGSEGGAPTGIESGRFVSPEVGIVLSVSPDGRQLLVGDGGQICLQSIDEGGVRCTEWRGGSLGGSFAAQWTPDGSKVVIVDQRVAVQLMDSHSIWVVDVAAPSVRSWADLGARTGQGVAGDVGLAPDGGSVAFAGLDGAGQQGVFLVPEPGATELLSDLPQAASVVWDPKGSSVTFSGMRGGVWRVTVDGGAPTVITDSEALGWPVIVDVSRDESTILVLWIGLAQRLVRGESFFGLVSADDGSIIALKDPIEDGFVGPMQAALSPDGDWVAFTYIEGVDGGGPYRLAVRSVDGGGEMIVSADLQDEVGVPPSGRMPLADTVRHAVWTQDDRLILLSNRGEWVLVIGLRR
jgi:Tol biopolymer transport system component